MDFPPDDLAPPPYSAQELDSSFLAKLGRRHAKSPVRPANAGWPGLSWPQPGSSLVRRAGAKLSWAQAEGAKERRSEGAFVVFVPLPLVRLSAGALLLSLTHAARMSVVRFRLEAGERASGRTNERIARALRGAHLEAGRACATQWSPLARSPFSHFASERKQRAAATMSQPAAKHSRQSTRPGRRHIASAN